MIETPIINIYSKVGKFAENKDKARDIRIKEIIPKLNENREVILDFDNVEATTQSFVHALISDLFRKYGDDILEKVSFKNCSATVKKIIEIVVDYMQQRDQ